MASCEFLVAKFRRMSHEDVFNAGQNARPVRLTALAVVLAAGTAGMSAPPAAASASSLAVPATGVSPAATAATLQAWPVLQEGSNSAWPRVTVRSLQYLLNAHGAKLT